MNFEGKQATKSFEKKGAREMNVLVLRYRRVFESERDNEKIYETIPFECECLTRDFTTP